MVAGNPFFPLLFALKSVANPFSIMSVPICVVPPGTFPGAINVIFRSFFVVFTFQDRHYVFPLCVLLRTYNFFGLIAVFG